MARRWRRRKLKMTKAAIAARRRYRAWKRKTGAKKTKHRKGRKRRPSGLRKHRKRKYVDRKRFTKRRRAPKLMSRKRYSQWIEKQLEENEKLSPGYAYY